MYVCMINLSVWYLQELKKIKKGLRQMSQWFSEALEMEDDQEEEEEEQKGCLCKHKTENPKVSFFLVFLN